METSLLPLHATVRLSLDEGACLPLRSDFGGCRACAATCPAHVIAVDADAVTLADGCLECGRCVAACPTDALRLDGFGEALVPPPGSDPVEVECAKVPTTLRARGAVEVPCLGALSLGRLAELHERAGERGVTLVDRGWCGGCAAGCADGVPPVAAVHARLVLWLDAVGDPRPAPTRVTRALPAPRMPAAIPPPAARLDGPTMSRRRFFRAVLPDPAARARDVTPMGGACRPAHPANRRRAAPDRVRLLAALERAATRAGTAVPAEAFPRVANNGACADHRVCTAACPTGALKVEVTGGEASLAFAGAACIGCGACARACPEGALAVDAHGGAASPVEIARHAQRECRACGDPFTPRADEAFCLACEKSRRFVGDAMAQLFRARP
ncbi:MAG: 4Fe-4S binding protein [Burkholderiales bacterium]|nr:4Fe-4S binding protein [Burkholderiales bacterium]